MTWVAGTATRLGTGDWESLFEIGQFRELLGRLASDFRGGDRPPKEPPFELDRADEYATVDPSATYQPVHLTGRLIVPKEESPTSLAVAINGVVRGVTETFIDGESVRFTCLLPRGALTAGENDIEVLRITGSPGAPRVRRLRQRRLERRPATHGNE